MARLERLLLSAMIALLLWQMATRAQSALARNQDAVLTVASCAAAAPKAQASASGIGTLRWDAWFEGTRAHCQGDARQAQVLWSAALRQSESRLPLVRAVARYDVELAALAAEQYPGRAEAHFWLGDALAHRKDAAAAIQAYERGLALQPGNADAWDALGLQYQTQGQWWEAARAFEQACRHVDQGKNGCWRAGQIYLQQGLYARAAASFQASVQQIGYFFGPAEEGLATALLALNRTEEAIPHLRILAEH